MSVVIQKWQFCMGKCGARGVGLRYEGVYMSPCPHRAAFRDRARGPLCMAERPTRGQPHINPSPRIDFWSTEPLRAETEPKGRR
jgi:hypothetical protein